MLCPTQKAGIGFPAYKVSDCMILFSHRHSRFIYQGEGETTNDGITSAMNRLEGEFECPIVLEMNFKLSAF